LSEEKKKEIRAIFDERHILLPDPWQQLHDKDDKGRQQP